MASVPNHNTQTSKHLISAAFTESVGAVSAQRSHLSPGEGLCICVCICVCEKERVRDRCVGHTEGHIIFRSSTKDSNFSPYAVHTLPSGSPWERSSCICEAIARKSFGGDCICCCCSAAARCARSCSRGAAVVHTRRSP